MNQKRILIVDDEDAILTVLKASLKKLGGDYHIVTAKNGLTALEQLQRESFDLVLTDYNMPDMNGLDLARALHAISPQTHIVLMTAYGSDNLRSMVGQDGLSGYIDKPFTLAEIQQIVKRAVESATRPKPEQFSAGLGQGTPGQPAQDCLRLLLANTGARCVLLLSANGYPVCTVGESKKLDIASISALVAANFLAASELARLLGSHGSTFKSSHHDGPDYNIYAYDINGDLLLAVIFGSHSKPGAVWFYTRQTAAELASLVPHQPAQPAIISRMAGTALDAEFDKLFSSGEKSPPAAAPENLKNSKPMTFSQAVAAGLVPPQLMKRELKHGPVTANGEQQPPRKRS